MTFIVPTSSYTRHNKNGSVITVTRKAFTRRTLKPDAWQYHLREMAASEDALLYIRRFIVRQEDVDHFRSDEAMNMPMADPSADTAFEGPAA